jgi:hypothetical protein
MIKVTEQEDGRFYAEYINPADIVLNTIGQYGKTGFEARINLLALLISVKRKVLSTSVIIPEGF